MDENKGRPVSIAPSTFVDDTPAEHIARMSLNHFIETTGRKLMENSTPDQWIETSWRTRIPGMMELYKDFCDSISIYSVLRTQELHWLSYCQVTRPITDVLATYRKAQSSIVRSEYVDLFTHKADTDVLHLGKPSSVPTGYRHHAAVAAELGKFADAFALDYSEFSEIGRAWSLTTVLGSQRKPKYAAWSARVFVPIYKALLARSVKLVEAREEAMYLLKFRRARKGTEKGGH